MLLIVIDAPGWLSRYAFGEFFRNFNVATWGQIEATDAREGRYDSELHRTSLRAERIESLEFVG